MKGLGIFSYTLYVQLIASFFFFLACLFFLWHIRKLSQTIFFFFFFKRNTIKKTPSEHLHHTNMWDNSINADYFPGNITPGILCFLALVQTDRNLQLSSWDFLFSLSSDAFLVFWKLCCPPTLYFNFNGMHLLILPEKMHGKWTMRTREVICIFLRLTLYYTYDLEIISLIRRLHFHCLISSFWMTEDFLHSPIFFTFVVCVFAVKSKKPVSNPKNVTKLFTYVFFEKVVSVLSLFF